MVEKQAQLEALELLFYADRYRRLKLIVTIDSETGFHELVNDIRSIHLAHIPAVYILRSFTGHQKIIEQLTLRGLPLQAIAKEELLEGDASSRLTSIWEQNIICLLYTSPSPRDS